ncbi:MAG: GAF domain-containing protein [Acidobacteria bacterium]|nr:GAF domain-containing protein [Acidobacteriota bacterium]
MPTPAQIEEENRGLRRSVRELSTLAEITNATGAADSLEDIIELLTQKCVSALDAEQAVIYLLSDDELGKGGLETFWRQQRSSGPQGSFSAGKQILGWMLQNQRALTVNDPAGDERFSDLAEGQPRLRSLLAAPLRFKGAMLGAVLAFNKRDDGGFDDADRRLLGIIAGHAAPVLRTAQLIGELRQDRDRLATQNTQLLREVRSRFSPQGILGSSAPIQEALRMVERVRDADVDVLITGESGTGKEVFAKAIHYSGLRADGPFVALNCAALPESLVEAELFGIEKGVATGVEKRIGQFEAAQHGTLFLDEIGELPPGTQAKILRVLQERRVQRLGARSETAVDVRVVAATNRDLEAEIRAGRFREDLFYRLNVIRIRTPALREIRDDIPELAHSFLREIAGQMRRSELTFSPEALDCLGNAPWPGNVRQLQNEVKRAAICAMGKRIEPGDFSPEVARAAVPPKEAAAGEEAAEEPSSLEAALAEHERRLVEKALAAHGFNQARTAETLGISRQGLIKKMKRLGVAASAGD